MIKSSNPALQGTPFTGVGVFPGVETMTIQGTVNKSFFLTGLVILSAAVAWTQAGQYPQYINIVTTGGALLGFMVALITIWKKHLASWTAPLYAIIEGIVLGLISLVFETQFQGIVFQAFISTMGTLIGLLFAYKSGFIKATENFKLGVCAATFGIMIVYLITMVLGFFHITIPYIHDNSIWGIAFSIFVVIVAALNLVMDFDFIEHGAQVKAPKYMEWYASFALMVTLIWLYLEILRLLAKSRSRK